MDDWGACSKKRKESQEQQGSVDAQKTLSTSVSRLVRRLLDQGSMGKNIAQIRLTTHDAAQGLAS